MEKLMKYIILVVLTTFALDAYSASTSKSKIKTFLYNGNADFVFFTPEESWEVKDSDGNVLCTPHYVQVTSSVAGRDKLMSAGLAAKMSGSVVDFVGECDASQPAYFNAYYIRIY